MSAPPAPSLTVNAELLACLACGDLFTPHGLAGGVLPILFSCGHTVCTECAEAAALSLPVSSIKWACGIPSCIANPTAGGDSGCVNAGLVALVQFDAGPPAEPATLVDAVSSKKRKRHQGKLEAALDFSALCDEAESAIAFSLSDVDRVNSARRTMREGFEASRTTFIAGIDSLLSAIIAHRDRVLGEATRLFDAREKALEAQVEELSVKVSLLQQAVYVCKAVMAGSVELTPEVYESVRKGVKGLTGTPFGGLAVCPVAGLGVDIEAALEGVEANVYVKRGVSASHCEMSGPGLDSFLVRDGGTGSSNVFTLMCRDDRSDAVDVDVREVSLRVLPFEADDGGPCTVLVSNTPDDDELGIFKLEYAVVSENVRTVDIDVRVYGEVVQHCPVRVQSTLFPLSTVLSTVDSAALWLFTRGMRSWLPTTRNRKPSLLFRMTCDGKKTSDFHSRCDGKGPTVVLILSSNGFVFGGYADKAWSSTAGYITVDRKSFIFTVSNPHDIPPTRYLVNNPAAALLGGASFGPNFGRAIEVGDGDGSLTSGCGTPFNDYTDTTGKGAATFTGATDEYGYFIPAEVEVWQV